MIQPREEKNWSQDKAKSGGLSITGVHDDWQEREKELSTLQVGRQGVEAVVAETSYFTYTIADVHSTTSVWDTFIL